MPRARQATNKPFVDKNIYVYDCVCVLPCLRLHTHVAGPCAVHTCNTLCMCVRAFVRVCLPACVRRQHPDRKLLLISAAGQCALVKEEGRVRGGEAWLPCCPPCLWIFWQPIRGRAIRPHTCFMFGELAAGCCETDAVAGWEEWTSRLSISCPSPFPVAGC